ncbi:nuclear transport factor 2 family protein [Parahaliea mediterranea]|uniref:nuclear transport factor 2 family protein n=1 Tax=Parahaliea mediterranea TaxID=651086 RepID=UPI000E2F68B6|nr:nuclear transport factor 2 family protein [Parahaliea mediterranea]
MPGSDSADHTLRSHNADLFRTMLAYLGQRDYANCARYLAQDVYADWPYRPMPTIPDRVTGRDNLIGYFRGEVDGSDNEGLDEFTPLDYEIETLHELLDPNVLIAEYASHARHIPSGKPYNNRYVGIVRFKDDEIVYWREYVNPAVIYEIYDLLKLPTDTQ